MLSDGVRRRSEHTPRDDTADLFDAYVNVCPGQGSRTIRTEEALLITLAMLGPRVAAAQRARGGGAGAGAAFFGGEIPHANPSRGGGGGR